MTIKIKDDHYFGRREYYFKLKEKYIVMNKIKQLTKTYIQYFNVFDLFISKKKKKKWLGIHFQLTP